MNNENSISGKHPPTATGLNTPPFACPPERRTGDSLPDEPVNLSDFALFLSVMKNREAYECVLSIILDEPDLKLREVHVEDVIPNKRGKRSVRLDVRGTDSAGRQIGAEMQNDILHDDLRKRVRYYQSMLDTPVLKSGKSTRYRELPSTCIILITQKDLFGKDCAEYVFEERCRGIPELPLSDGTMKIFLNMESRRGRPELVSLLQYMKDSRLENPSIMVKDKRIIRLDEIVREVKQTEEWEEMRMSIYSVGVENGKEIGKKIGKEIGKEIGRKEGMKRGEDNFAVLTRKLLMASRTDDLLRAANDRPYRDSLYREYGIQR